jgi:3-hydroxybutyrate dehydrogenase
MNDVLTGKVALITGGTRGLGRGIAEAFLAEGASVVINGRTESKGQATVEELGVPERVRFVGGDVGQQAVCERLVAETVDTFGSIDILVNNAGGSGGNVPVHEMLDDDWNRVLDLNLNHTFWCTRAALRHMVPARFGRIINMSSIYGKVALANTSHYVTTKHAIVGFTKAVAQETGPLGITCNALCPGVVLTDIWLDTGPASAEAMGMSFDDYVAMIVATSATKQPNTVEQVAAMALLLASPAGAGITGTALSIDGGTAPY